MGSLKALLFFCLLSSALFSCKKEQKAIPVKSQYQLLTQGSWVLVEAYTNTEKDGVHATQDIYGNMDDCQKDDIVTFTKDGHEVLVDQGPLKCDVASPQTSVNQTWVLVSNTQIELTHLVFETSYEAKILELSETVLLIRVYGTWSDGTSFETTYKYNRAS